MFVKINFHNQTLKQNYEFEKKNRGVLVSINFIVVKGLIQRQKSN